MKEQHLEILSDGLKLQAVLNTPDSSYWPLIVLCHGFLSHKDSSKYRLLAQIFARESIATVRFDFRGCGESEGLLSESSISRRWRDLQRVIDQILDLEGFDGRMGLLGSSLGGYLALLEMSHNFDIRCAAVWSTPSHLHDLAKRLPEVSPVEFSQECYKDLLTVELLPRLKNVQRVLVVHGQEDQQVPLDHASQLYEVLDEPKALHILAGADHRFTASEWREEAIRLTLEWFRRYL
ncbi:MAG: alpha/beta fold hydrolase [Deltaproteobacteria bacterium]|nr:alpha/beta fold hydrolase [Deltaproteobacteria bacterium]